MEECEVIVHCLERSGENVARQGCPLSRNPALVVLLLSLLMFVFVYPLRSFSIDETCAKGILKANSLRFPSQSLPTRGVLNC